MAVQQRGEQTREGILEAAAECFARNGYDATGVAEICRRAGVSKGAFYHHFPTKQAVFLELLDTWLGGVDAQLEGILSEAATVPDGLRSMAGVAGFVFAAAGEQLPIFLEFLAKASHDDAVWQATIEQYRRYREFFTRMVEKGIAEGSLRPVDPQMAAHVIVSMAVGMILQGLLAPEEADWGSTVQAGIQVLLEGLETKQG